MNRSTIKFPSPSASQNQATTARQFLLLALLLVAGTTGFGQFNVAEIITDFDGYWKSSATVTNPVKPNNSHNLLSFSFKGNRFSTGVNDALLTTKGQAFIAGDYRALPMKSTGTTVTSDTKIGLGSMYDGVANGPSAVAPVNNIPSYLTDGIKGLDLGTCVANLPAGTMLFPIAKVLSPAIGDNVPDIVITQVADPSGSLDRYEFTDINGNRVGNYVDITLSNIPPVGNWTADFYEASKNPMTLSSGFTKTDRPIRLWASDLSAFGINSNNASAIAYFKITLNGSSDVAFVAYNNDAINIISALLPVKLSSFAGKAFNQQSILNWETASEINSDVFIVEKSIDGVAFSAIDNVPAKNNGLSNTYTYNDKNATAGKNYYRLKMMDKDGHFEYSKTIMVKTTADASNSIGLYPNPAKNYVVVNHPFSGNNEQLQLVNLQGNTILLKKITAGGFQTRIDLPALPSGAYELVWTNGKDIVANRMVIL